MTTRYQIKDGVFHELLGDELIVHNTLTDETTLLHKDVAKMLDLLREPRNLDYLVNKVAALYRSHPVEVREPVEETLEKLKQTGFVEEIIAGRRAANPETAMAL